MGKFKTGDRVKCVKAYDSCLTIGEETVNKCRTRMYKFFGGLGTPDLPLAAAEEILAVFDKYKLER